VSSVDDCRLVELPRIERPEGSITPIEAGATVDFDIARVYYIYDLVGGSERGGHAHLELQQLMVAVMGAFTVVLDDGRRRREIELNRSYLGLHIPRMIWRELRNFSSGAVCVVLASIPYSEEDYVREYDEFLKLRAVG
jgi:dTDP-4-dehydrorhamnose 3,5-epimerase-like enzyme